MAAEWTHLPICPPARSLAISGIRFLSPSNAAWMLLLLNIICISCFSTCNAHFCPCLTHSFWSGSHFECLLHRFFTFFILSLTKWTLRQECGCSASVMAWHKSLAGYDCVFWEVQRKLWPHIVCVTHMHFCIWLSHSIPCNKGTQVLLWAWINETFRAPEKEREREWGRGELWRDTFSCLFPVIFKAFISYPSQEGGSGGCGILPIDLRVIWQIAGHEQNETLSLATALATTPK